MSANKCFEIDIIYLEKLREYQLSEDVIEIVTGIETPEPL